MARSKAESFTAYLEEKQRLERAPRPTSGGGTALSILGSLAVAPGGRMAAADLQSASGMSLVNFAESLKRLQDSGYLKLTGEPGREIAELTALGRDVADLARPA